MIGLSLMGKFMIVLLAVSLWLGTVGAVYAQCTTLDCPAGTSIQGATCIIDANTTGHYCVRDPIDCDPTTPEGPENPLLAPVCAFYQIPILVGWVLEVTMMAGAVMAFAAILLGGFFYTTAGDNPAQAQKGRLTIQWAVVGLILAASIFVLLKTIAPMLGFDGIFVIRPPTTYAQETGSIEDTTLIQIRGQVITQQAGRVIPGARVSLFKLSDEATWQLWLAQNYDNQRNPFITDSFGQFRFRVPAGQYYLYTNKTNYYETQSDPITVESTPIKVNLRLESAPTMWNYFLYVGIPILLVLMIWSVVRFSIRWRHKQILRTRTLKRLQRHPEDVESPQITE